MPSFMDNLLDVGKDFEDLKAKVANKVAKPEGLTGDFKIFADKQETYHNEVSAKLAEMEEKILNLTNKGADGKSPVTKMFAGFFEL